MLQFASRRVRKCLMIAITAGAILPFSQSIAGGSQGEDTLARFVRPGIDGLSRHDRVAVAEALRDELVALQNVLPPLSPREEDWVKGEFQRIGQLEGSESLRQMFLLRQKPEVARDDARKFLATQIAWIHVITNEDIPGAEMSAWAGLASTLLESLRYEQIVLVVETESLVVPRGYLNDKIKDGGEVLGFTRELLARKILEQIVVPNTAPEAVQQAYRNMKRSN